MPKHCKYEIHIKGKKKAALMMCAVMPYATYKNIVKEYGCEDCYIIHLIGDSFDPLDANCRFSTNTAINLVCSEEEIRDWKIGEQYWNLPIRQKSELLGLELLIRSWSKDLEFDQLEKYKNGYFVSIEGLEYHENNKFDFEF